MSVGVRGGRVQLESLDWQVLRLAAGQYRKGAGTRGLADALGVDEDVVIESARRLERAGFLTLEVNE